MVEYQKIKIQNYNFRLQNYLIETKYKAIEEKNRRCKKMCN